MPRQMLPVLGDSGIGLLHLPIELFAEFHQLIDL